jgi:type I restriction enzyme S subunit
VNTAEFKDSPLGRIPVDWDVVRVLEVFDVFTGTTPSTKLSEFWDGGDVVWITPADMSDLNGIFISDSERKVTVDALKKTNLNRIPVYSIVISTRAPVGYVALNTVECTFNQGCKALVPSRSGIDTRYFAYYLLLNNKRLQHLSGGSTFKELNKETLKKIYLPLPPLEEQKKISEILQDVDSAIENVNKAIDTTEKLKRGLMQRLLMEGINHTEFKDSPLGRIPVDWDVVRFEDVVENMFYGVTAKAVDFKTDLRMLRTTDIKNYSFDPSKLPYCEMTEKKKKIDKYTLKKGDLLITRSGTVGVSVLLHDDFRDVIFGSYLIKAELSKDVHPKFLHYYFQSKLYWNQLNRVQGSTLKNINLPLLKSLKIILPPIDEQKRISEILQDVDRRLELLRERKVKLENIKRGLMNDLLTGKRRVRITS